jgi:hypothetical protein
MLLTINYLIKESKEVEAPPEVARYMDLLAKHNKHTITKEERKELYALMDKNVIEDFIRDFAETFSPYQVCTLTHGEDTIYWEDWEE